MTRARPSCSRQDAFRTSSTEARPTLARSGRLVMEAGVDHAASSVSAGAKRVFSAQAPRQLAINSTVVPTCSA